MIGPIGGLGIEPRSNRATMTRKVARLAVRLRESGRIGPFAANFRDGFSCRGLSVVMPMDTGAALGTSSFCDTKLDIAGRVPDDHCMVDRAHKQVSRGVAAAVRARVSRGGERIWRMADFRGLPVDAVAQALSRLARSGGIARLSKGIYYRGLPTTLGRSLPHPALLRRLLLRRATVFPSGLGAAHSLGFSTQSPARIELSTTANSLPRKLITPGAIVRTRRPAPWARLGAKDAACLEFLRQSGAMSELADDETAGLMRRLLREETRFERLARVAATEPPRVRAMLGALGELNRAAPEILTALRRTLNPASRFAFGAFAALSNAKAWQCREAKG